MEADIHVQWGQLIDIFLTREDLIHHYFQMEKINSGKINEMINHFMKGTGKTTKPRCKRQTPTWRVHPGIGETEWEYMAGMVTSFGIFDSALSPEELESLLSGTLEHPVRARENNYVSFLLGQLSVKKILPFKWQHLFGTEEKILSAKDGRPLNNKRLRDSWNAVKNYDYGLYNKIKKFVSRVAGIINGDKS